MSEIQDTIERGKEVAKRHRRRYGLRPGQVVGYPDNRDPLAYQVRSVDKKTGTVTMGFVDRKTGRDVQKTDSVDELVDVNIIRKIAHRIFDRRDRMLIRQGLG